MKAPNRIRLVWMGEVHRRATHEFCGLPAKELCDRIRTVEPVSLWRKRMSAPCTPGRSTATHFICKVDDANLGTQEVRSCKPDCEEEEARTER